MKSVTILVTGTNSGLGYAVCCRLMDEFLHTSSQTQKLHLLFSTRDAQKRDITANRLSKHLQKTIEALHRTDGSAAMIARSRIALRGVLVDLTQLVSVRALADELLKEGALLDVVIWNAGMTGWSGQKWGRATWDIMKSVVNHTTHPRSAKVVIGQLAKSQLPPSWVHSSPVIEPTLGQVFLANVFGHYMLTHWLSPLFEPHTRIIWSGSISATADSLDLDDLQGLKTDLVYEASKRLIELLVLTSELGCNATNISNLLGASHPRPRMYMTHPGVCVTSIAGLHKSLGPVMGLLFHQSRLLGSKWHVVKAYKGAASIVYCALTPSEQLDHKESTEGKGKWGSAVLANGDEQVLRTDVEGWGYCGKLNVVTKDCMTSTKGRYRRHQPLTEETRSQFSRDGEKAWVELERMRAEWETLIREASWSSSLVDIKAPDT